MSSPSMNAEETAYEAIVKMVLSKEFAPGDRLIESEIAEELGLSRTPVRNALRKLTAVGFLENPPKPGMFHSQAGPPGHGRGLRIPAAYRKLRRRRGSGTGQGGLSWIIWNSFYSNRKIFTARGIFRDTTKATGNFTVPS